MLLAKFSGIRPLSTPQQLLNKISDEINDSNFGRWKEPSGGDETSRCAFTARASMHILKNCTAIWVLVHLLINNVALLFLQHWGILPHARPCAVPDFAVSKHWTPVFARTLCTGLGRKSSTGLSPTELKQTAAALVGRGVVLSTATRGKNNRRKKKQDLWSATSSKILAFSSNAKSTLLLLNWWDQILFLPPVSTRHAVFNHSLWIFHPAIKHSNNVI